MQSMLQSNLKNLVRGRP